MANILLDTNFVSDFAKSCPVELDKHEIYIPVLGMCELLQEGFEKRRGELNNFFQRNNVHLLKSFWLVDDELENYPLTIGITEYLFLPKPQLIEKLLESKNLRSSLVELSDMKIEFKQNIERIRDSLNSQRPVIETAEQYRHFIKSRLPSKIKNKTVKLKHVPFNSLLRLFPLEKYFIQNAEYEEQDFNDISICLESIYFDFFFTEKTNHDILNKIKSLFPDIFINDCKIFCNKSRFKQAIKEGGLT